MLMPIEVLVLLTSATLPAPGRPPVQLPAVSHAPPLAAFHVEVNCASSLGETLMQLAKASAASARRVCRCRPLSRTLPFSHTMNFPIPWHLIRDERSRQHAHFRHKSSIAQSESADRWDLLRGLPLLGRPPVRAAPSPRAGKITGARGLRQGFSDCVQKSDSFSRVACGA